MSVRFAVLGFFFVNYQNKDKTVNSTLKDSIGIISISTTSTRFFAVQRTMYAVGICDDCCRFVVESVIRFAHPMGV